jgi:hypothetical protein
MGRDKNAGYWKNLASSVGTNQGSAGAPQRKHDSLWNRCLAAIIAKAVAKLGLDLLAGMGVLWPSRPGTSSRFSATKTL